MVIALRENLEPGLSGTSGILRRRGESRKSLSSRSLILSTEPSAALRCLRPTQISEEGRSDNGEGGVDYPSVV